MATATTTTTTTSRESILSSLGSPKLQETALCRRKLATRAHFQPGGIINAPLHAANVDAKRAGRPHVVATAAGPVFSKRRFLVVLWRHRDRAVCLPLYSGLQGHRRGEYAGLTTAGDAGWECEAAAPAAGGLLRLKDVEGRAWRGKVGRSYVNLAFPVGVDMMEDVVHDCGLLDADSYVALVRMFRFREQVALDEALAHRDFRAAMQEPADLRWLGAGEARRPDPPPLEGGLGAVASPSLGELPPSASARTEGREGRLEEKEDARKKEAGKRKTVERQARKKAIEKKKMQREAKKKERRKASSKSKKEAGKAGVSKASSNEPVTTLKKSFGVAKRRVLPARRAKVGVTYEEGSG